MVESKVDVQLQGIKVGFKQLFSNKILNWEFNSALSAKSWPFFALFRRFQAIFAPRFETIFFFWKKFPLLSFSIVVFLFDIFKAAFFVV